MKNLSKVLSPYPPANWLTAGFLFMFTILPQNSIKAQLLGNPFIYNFSPEEYQAHNQSWGITQLANGHIAVGTGSGIVIFDGVEFETVKGTPAMITDLLTTSSGHTYYGMTNLFGQILPDSSGYPTYHSLKELIDEEEREFGVFWNMIEWRDEILISTRNSLFRFNGERFESVAALENTLFKIFEVNGKLYMGEMETGLLTLNEDFDLAIAPGGQAFSSELIPYFMLPYNDQQALVGTVRRGLFLYQTHGTEEIPEGALIPFENEINDELISASATYGISLDNGWFAIGTSTGGVFIINQQGELIQRVFKENGLEVDVVNSLFQDNSGNLWIALNYGFAIAEIHHPVSFYDGRNGLEGSVIDAVDAGGKLYAATTLGLFHRDGNRFAANRAVTATTWDLDLFEDPDSPGEPGVLAANNFGIYLVRGEETRQLSANYGMSVMQSELQPQRIFAGTPSGLFYIEKEGGAFTHSEVFLETGNPVRQLMEDDDGGIWIATQSDGIRYINPDLNPERMRVYREDEGYFVKFNPTMHQIGDTLFVSTITNFYQYDAEGDTFIEWRNPALGEGDLSGIYRFYNKQGRVWAGSSSRRSTITEFRNFFSGEVKQIDHPFRAIPQTVTLFINEIYDDLWFGNARGLFRYSTDTRESIPELPSPHIRRIDLISDTTRTFLPASEELLSEPFGNTRIRFTVASPWFDSSRQMEYRFYLQGYDEQWSAWTTNHVVEYTTLPESEYLFQAQARNREGVESRVSDYPFVIHPPWFRTVWAYLIYTFLFGLFIYLVVYSSNHYKTVKLEAFNRKLEEEVAERSEKIRQQNEILREMNREKNDFMNIAVHDLRNPLSGIQGIGELLSMKDNQLTQEEIIELGKTINQSSNRMFELIDNYLNVYRIEQQQIKPNPAAVSARELIGKTIHRFTQELSNKKMVVKTAEPDVDAVLFSDPLLTTQIIENLLSNAIKYSPSGSEISIGVQISDGAAEIYVRDEGPGIPYDKQGQLFQKFSQIGTKPTGGEVSVGLGLSIVKKLAEMMNGDVRCESEPGKGAAFYVSLPKATSERTI